MHMTTMHAQEVGGAALRTARCDNTSNPPLFPTQGWQRAALGGKDEPVLTTRALVSGLVVGTTLLCFSNTWFGLQSGVWVTMGSLQVRVTAWLARAPARAQCLSALWD